MTIGEALSRLIPDITYRFEAYDGSAAGPEGADFKLVLKNERGLRYMLTAPGDLGLARAYIMGDLELVGAHPGDPYPALSYVKDHTKFSLPNPVEVAKIVSGLGLSNLVPPPAPAQEHMPRWRRMMEGALHSRKRDAEVIHHHYDVSNRFYELVLGESMTYTCACYPTAEATLEEAQFNKYDLVCKKLGLQPGMRLLDIGSGWGGMVRHAAKHYGVTAVGVTLSQEQALWAETEIKRQGLDQVAEVRFGDYRDIAETGFDAVSSIGLTEHIGVKNYPAYFSFIKSKLVRGGRLLNHCITRYTNKEVRTGAFIDRYVFPDGELTGSGRIITEIQNAGLEVRHEENLREHYAMTCGAWNKNLADNWDECVAEVGEATAKIWGLYLAGSRIGFEINEIQLHQVLAVLPHEDGNADFPLRPTWLS
ncbi:MAG: cyclopropane-fatty-acyl-phospholipid synthase family protein [Nocardioidaceae bacterium]